MLAPEDEARAMDALRFSLASDIVELVVLTVDDIFLQTLREAVGGSRRLWHVPSADKVGDLLIAGGVGILVLDVHALQDTGALFITEIKRQFPDLVVVVAGNREAETALARLISNGTVYRFIHKPMSPARARLFADAAVKKYEEQRKRTGGAAPTAAAAPGNRGLWVGGICTLACLLAGGIWLAQRSARQDGVSAAGIAEPVAPNAGAPASLGPAADAALLARAAQALAANRLTAPSGDNALELYLQELGRNPGNADARAGIAEVHERLLARAENALLEERLDEASSAIETARRSGVESGRIAFLASQLGKARAQKAAADAARVKLEAAKTQGNTAAAQADQFAALALERIKQEHLLEPAGDSGRFYVEEALRADPNSEAAQQAQQALALALLTAARGAIDRRDFARASNWLDSAADIAAPANIDNLRQVLLAARREAEGDAENQLLKSAEERLRDDRLAEPENDSASYYLITLRAVDPANAHLAGLTQELGARLVVKGKSALALQQYDAARSWLDDAAAIGYSSPDASALKRDLDAAVGRQKFLADVVAANQLELLKSVQPVYPNKAQQRALEGWVELDFTVDDSGAVQDIGVRAASPPGVFDQAAIGALSQWRYKPVVRDGKPVSQRARIRIRFALAR